MIKFDYQNEKLKFINNLEVFEMKVSVIMGSKSDYPVLQEAVEFLRSMGVHVNVRALSAHRTPKQVFEHIANIENEGYEVIIAAAGKAAHLPGVIAAHTVMPVIGLPIKSSTLDGLDSLLSIVQMPKGIPVATVAIDGGLNAAILSLQILSVKYPELKEKLNSHREEMAQKVLEDDASLQ